MALEHNHARQALLTVQQKLGAKSASLLLAIECSLPRIMTLWFILAIPACAVRIAVSPLKSGPELDTLLPYLLLVTAPLLSMGLALYWFCDGERLPQPTTRLAIAGRWHNVSADEARRHPLYGSSGIMVSLLVGTPYAVPFQVKAFIAPGQKLLVG
jgi:hypothetical protein